MLPLLAQPKKKTTHLNTKNNQNCQKIEVYGSLTTKELNKKHSSRLVGGAETGSQGGEDVGQGSSHWWTGQARWWLVHQIVPYSRADKLGGTTGEQDKAHNPGFQHWENKASEPLDVKTCGGCDNRRNCQSLESRTRAEKVVLFPLRPFPLTQGHNTAK